jgi:ADP-ribose pyrophosphatase YjhB (NUDIX family)
MLLDFLFQLWKRLRGNWQWRALWLVNSKFMVCVAGVVLDDQGRVLLQRHRHWVPDVWGLPGGIVHGGETLEAAFAREVSEETGLNVKDIQLVRVVSGYRMRLEVFFQARVTGETSVRLQESEVLEVRFFPLEALPEKILPQQKNIILTATSSFPQ